VRIQVVSLDHLDRLTDFPPPAVERWMAELAAADRHLRRGRWAEGRRRVDALLLALCEHPDGGGSSGALLGAAVMLRGLARAALGENEEALWDWWAVRSLAPRLSRPAVHLYGPAARVLEPARLEARWRSCESKRGADLPPTLPPPEERTARSSLSRPVRLTLGEPRLPKAWRRNDLEDGAAAIEVVIDVHGRAHSPRSLFGEAPAVFSLLEAARHWRFHPAERQGEPLAVFTTLCARFGGRRAG
jgi:hypothetical protein